MNSALQKIISMILAILLIASALLFSANARADIKLTKLPNWIATTLPGHRGFKLKQSAIPTEPMAISWRASDILVSKPTDSLPVFALTLDSLTDLIYQADIGFFSADSDPVVIVLIEKIDQRPPLPLMLDTLLFYKLTYDLITGDSIGQELLLQEATFTNATGTSFPTPVLLESFSPVIDSTGYTMFTLGKTVEIFENSFIIEETAGSSILWGNSALIPVKSYPFLISDIYQTDSRFAVARTLSISMTNPISFPRGEFRQTTRSLGLIGGSLTWNSVPLSPFLPNCGTTVSPNKFSNTTQEYLIAGDLMPDNGLQEIIIRQHRSNSCTSVSYWEMFSVDDSQRITSLINPYPIESDGPLRWSFVIDEEPGFFYSVVRNNLYKFDASNGVAIDSTTESLPTGLIGWYDLFGDGNKYLVTLNDSHVEAYGFDFVTDVTDNEGPIVLPASFSLSDPYPNPFNPRVSFSVSTKQKTEVTITIYNVLGQQVASIFSGVIHIGETSFVWDAGIYSSGVYFIRAQTKDGPAESRKTVLLK